MTHCWTTRFTGLLAVASAVGVADAATIGYWQLDGDAGTTATTIASEANGASLDGTAAAVGAGAAPAYSANVPGAVILDGLNGPVINASNTTSLSFTGSPGTTNGGVVQINDPDGSAGLLEAATFTIEGFYRSSTDQLLSTIVAKQWGAGKYSWGLDTGYNNQNALHFLANQNFTNKEFTTSMPTNDGVWHHFAVTYSNGTATIYGDYVQLATVEYTLAYDDRPLLSATSVTAMRSPV